MIDLIDVEEPLRNALKIIGQYCKRNDCKTCELKINDDTCITDKDPDVWWMYLTADRKTEPQTDLAQALAEGKESILSLATKGKMAKRTERSE